jgi:DNA-binding transcriptional LysR family regulator
MQLRYLKSFVTLAEELHFGRAADRLGMTQSALSQQLQKLESELGTQLVVRTSREIALTEAGLALLDPALQSLAAVDRAADAVADLKAGRSSRLRIGSLSAGLNGPLATIVSRYRRQLPTSVIELHHYTDSAPQERALLAGELDLAILRRIAAHRRLASRQVAEESFVVYLPGSHPLAGRTGVRLEELAQDSIVFWRRQAPSFFRDSVIDACRAHGFEPRIEAYGDTLEAQLALVAAGVGVSLQVTSNASIARSGTVTVTVLDQDVRSTLWLAHLDTQRGPAVQAFLKCLET